MISREVHCGLWFLDLDQTIAYAAKFRTSTALPNTSWVERVSPAGYNTG